MCNVLKQEKNGVLLTYKVMSLAEVKFDPGFRVANWTVFESN